MTRTLGQVITETQLTAAATRSRVRRRWCLGAAAVIVGLGTGVGFAGGSRIFAPTSGLGRAAATVEIPMAGGAMCEVDITATSASGGSESTRPLDSAMN